MISYGAKGGFSIDIDERLQPLGRQSVVLGGLETTVGSQWLRTMDGSEECWRQPLLPTQPTRFLG